MPFPEYPGSPAHALFDQFDASSQLVSVSGDHAFIAPGPDDIRGPCPGLNAAANHAYLPRNGIATYEAVQTGLWEAFGLDQTATQVLQQTTTFFVCEARLVNRSQTLIDTGRRPSIAEVVHWVPFRRDGDFGSSTVSARRRDWHLCLRTS